MSKHALLRLALPATVLMAGTINLHAQTTPSGDSWQAGLVLDGAGTSRELELGRRDKGLGLGHSDLLVRGAFNEHFSGEAILGF
ncbi:MAG: hypothetical protein EBT99_13810, partial [Betaproteobacteria bacterium]|nr:hypothetical protein [Betaproteobacteria bacterium]